MNNQEIIEISLVDLVTGSGLVVQFILITLLLASVFSWAIIYAKWKSQKAILKENKQFNKIFWKSTNLEEIFHKSERFKHSPLASVFQSGYSELKKLSQKNRTKTGSQEMENIYRSLSRGSQEQISKLERHLSWLATIASASPFIGLLGTVWGIMNSFRNIGATGSASLAIVAPGISEALIATAIGLAAAIPAVIFYNYFGNLIKKQAVDMDCFSQDFLNLVQRSLISGSSK